MEEHGKVIAILNAQTGTSARTGNAWFSQSYVIEIDGRYTRKVAFNLWGRENNERAAIRLGEYITVLAEVEAHEFQGRWFNEVRAYDIQKGGQSVLRGEFVPQVQAVSAQQIQQPAAMQVQQPMMQQQAAQPMQNPQFVQPGAVQPGAYAGYPNPGVPPLNPQTGAPY